MWLFLVNHVFLPPKLPQEAESSAQLEEHLVKQVLGVLENLRAVYYDIGFKNEVIAIEEAFRAVSSILDCHDFPSDTGEVVVNAQQLQSSLDKLCSKGIKTT